MVGIMMCEEDEEEGWGAGEESDID